MSIIPFQVIYKHEPVAGQRFNMVVFLVPYQTVRKDEILNVTLLAQARQLPQFQHITAKFKTQFDVIPEVQYLSVLLVKPVGGISITC